MKNIILNDPETRSADVIAENLEHLKVLFPEAFTEGKVDFDVLKQLLGDAVDEREEKFGLNWNGKHRARQLALTPSTGTLRPCPEESVDWDTTQNLMIEGENLEVLKLLQKSYAGKVKLIYIDPPYNTGKDFVYPDDYRDNIRNYLKLTGQIDGERRRLSSNTEASGRFHTDWLNMIYPRLKLARNLLQEKGLIVVNIDDGEAAHLKLLMSEIFGEENFLAAISWEKRYTRSNNARLFYSLKDTLIAFRKSDAVNRLREKRGEGSIAIYSNPDDDPRGDWTSSSYVNPATKDQRPNLVYKIENPYTDKIIQHPTHAWKYEHSEHLRHVREKRLWWGQQGRAKFPRLKNFLAEMGDGVVPVDLWHYKTTGTTDEGGQEIKSLFGEAVFNNPKPTRLIVRLLALTNSVNTEDSGEPSVTLDFFSGSGTTGHAVMSQHAMEGDKHRFILVQLPEPLDPNSKDQKVAAVFCDTLQKPRNIAEITKERLRRAGRRIRDEHPMFTGDLGFRVFKLDTSNIRAWEPDPNDLDGALLENIDHIKQDRSEEDILYELLLKLGLDLCVPIETQNIVGKSVRSIGAGTLIACLDQKITQEEVEPLALGITDWHTKLEPAGDSTVIFRDSAFEDDVVKTNLVAILKQRGLGNVQSL